MIDATERLSHAVHGRYRIVGELGEGGMATVYLAEDLKHNRKVAIKVLKPELAAFLGAERFIQEIATTASLQHPNILSLFDSGEADGFLFYVMPYVDGESLRDRLDGEGQLGVEESVKLVTELADALEYAHEQGVVHRDIKPENILIHAGRPMVADFGIALAVSAAAGERMTETGLSLGTPHYMSPEQATAEKTITHRSDIYSLAAVLYEMLAGEPPHTGSSAQQIIMKIVTEEPAPITKLRRSVPSNVAAAMSKALEKLPADRFGNARAFASALEDPSFTFSPGSSNGAARREPRRAVRRWAIVAAAAVVASGIGAIGVWIGSYSSPGDRRVANVAVNLDPGESLNPGTGRDRANLDRPSTTLLALSPDGRTLVFAGWKDGHRSLLRRSIASGETTPISGTEGAESPFFSPSGRDVGFWADGWIERVPLDGGTPVQIAPVQYLFGASWGEDDHIVYAGDHTGLRRVSASGGAVDSLATEPDAHLPWMLPGGKAILYTVAYGSGFGQRRIESLDLKNRARTTVLDNAADARYLPGGHLAFARLGQLMVVPFDPSSLRVTGAPVGVLPDVMQAIGGGGPWVWTDAAQYAFSNRGDLAWLSGGITPPLNWKPEIVDRVGRGVPVDAPAEPYLTGRFSPDGRRIALSSPRPGAAGIWIVDLDRPGDVRNILPSGQGEDPGQLSAFIAWSPDGKRIVSGGGDSLVVVQAAGGARPTTLPGGTGQAPAQWLPGDTILTVTWHGSSGGEIGEVPVGGDSARIVLRETGVLRYPTVSPDGRWLAYTAADGDRENVVLRRWPSLEDRHVVAAGIQPAWSRGGRELLYESGPRLMAVDVRSEGSLGTPHELPQRVRGRTTPVRDWDVTANDGRILVLRADTTTSAPPAPVIHVILNWFDQLKETGR